MIKTIALASLLLVTAAQAKDYGTVNGDKITEDDISATLGQRGISFETLNKEMQKKVMDMVIDRKLLVQSVEKSDIEKSEEFKKELASLKKDLALDVWMKKEMKTLEDGLTDDKLEAYYKKNQKKFSAPKQLQARHILVKTEDEAKALIKELESAKDKKAKFIELAKTKSTGPSGVNGGDLGWFPLDRMVPEFSAAADKLKKGDYTKAPVKTQFGYHLIMLDDRKDASVKPFKEIKAQIKMELVNTKFTDKMKEKTDALRKSAKIELAK